MTRYDAKIAELKSLIEMKARAVSSIQALWAEETENLWSPELDQASELLDTARRTSRDLKREKENRDSVEGLLSSLTSVQTRKRDQIQRRALLIRSLSPVLREIGIKTTAAFHRGENPWAGNPQLFLSADRFETRYQDLLAVRSRLEDSRDDSSLWKSFKRAAGTFLNYLSIKRADQKLRDTYITLGLELAEAPDFLGPLLDLPLEDVSTLRISLEPLRLMKSVLDDLDAKEKQLKAFLEPYGAQISPARRLGELHRTLQVLQSRLQDLRIRRGQELWEAAVSGLRTPSAQESLHFENLEELNRDLRQIREDLGRYQAAADIQLLEDRNRRLEDKIRGCETQIRRLQGEVQILQGEIEANKSRIEEKTPLRGILEG